MEKYGKYFFHWRINTYRTNNPNKQSEVFNYEREIYNRGITNGYWILGFGSGTM